MMNFAIAFMLAHIFMYLESTTSRLAPTVGRGPEESKGKKGREVPNKGIADATPPGRGSGMM